MTLVDGTPKAYQYFVDALDVYASLCYHFGRYVVSEGKTHMFSVEHTLLNFINIWLV